MTLTNGEPRFTYDAVTQREVLEDPITAEVHLHTLTQRGVAGDSIRVVWLRMLRRLDAAAALGWQVLARAGGPATAEDVPATPLDVFAVTPAVRLANVLHWQDDFDTAHQLIDAAMTALDTVPDTSEHSALARYLLPYAYMHSARCFYDEGKFCAALGRARACLQMRRTTNASEAQIARTIDFIVATRTRLGIVTPDDISAILDIEPTWISPRHNVRRR